MRLNAEKTCELQNKLSEITKIKKELNLSWGFFTLSGKSRYSVENKLRNLEREVRIIRNKLLKL